MTVKLTAKSDRCPQCNSTNGEAYDDEYDTNINHSDNELVACRVFSCNDCGEKYDRPPPIKIKSGLELKWYEPPASARRHLSTPISLMG